MLARIAKSVKIVNFSSRHSRTAIFTQNKYYSDKADETTLNSANDQKSESNDKLGSFAKAFKDIEKLTENRPALPTESVPFKALLRQSPLIDLGDPLNKIVAGTIVHIVANDLYIDFGWKFHCVCVRPEKNGELYVRGAKVKLRIKDLELSSRFLGEDKDLTILEADCALIGLITSPKSQKKSH